MTLTLVGKIAIPLSLLPIPINVRNEKAKKEEKLHRPRQWEMADMCHAREAHTTGTPPRVYFVLRDFAAPAANSQTNRAAFIDRGR